MKTEIFVFAQSCDSRKFRKKNKKEITEMCEDKYFGFHT
jgi:hypothetical protein